MTRANDLTPLLKRLQLGPMAATLPERIALARREQLDYASFLGLRRVSLDEAAVAVGQVDDEAVGLALNAANDHQGLPEVALSLSRRMGQRHEHLPGLTAILPDVVLDRGVSAVETVLVPQRSKMRLAVWRCFLGRLRSSSRIRSMTPM